MNQGFNSAILSRCTLSETQTFTLPNPSYRSVAAITTVNSWRIANVHFTTSDERHRSQAQALLSTMPGTEKNILCGDWNFNNTATAYQELLNGGYTEAWMAIKPTGADNLGYTGYTNAEADDRIDMFFTTADLSVSDLQVIRHQECAVCQQDRDSNMCHDCSASDHLAVLVNVQ